MEHLNAFAADEAGVGTVEIILILVVLIALVLIFQKQITKIVNDIFDTITSKTNEVTG